ncbi:hypothetical protein lerEdw1_012617 [Lerista edwardsae]|nr:hypothetical protein lerEdw1_012617 [Lerista edwardsae]
MEQPRYYLQTESSVVVIACSIDVFAGLKCSNGFQHQHFLWALFIQVPGHYPDCVTQPIPIFLTLHNAAEVITCGTEKFVQKEQTPLLKICGALILLVAAGCLPLYDPEFDTDGYFWAFVHLLCAGAYKVYHKSWRSSSLSDSEQQYINYAFSVSLLAFASHPTGDLFSALEFPFLYFYRFHSSCFASGLLGFLLTLHTVKLKSSTSSGHYAAWSFLAKVITAGLSPFFFKIAVNVPTVC